MIPPAFTVIQEKMNEESIKKDLDHFCDIQIYFSGARQKNLQFWETKMKKKERQDMIQEEVKIKGKGSR